MFLCRPIEGWYCMSRLELGLGTRTTYVFDFFDGEVGVGWDSDCLRSDVYDDHDGSRNEPFEEFVDFLV